MKLQDAIDRARTESLNGYVQHVNKAGHTYNGVQEYEDYIVSDWYDETTVKSFENGVEL